MYVTSSTTSPDRLLSSCNHEMTSVKNVNGWNIFHNSKYTSLWGNFLRFLIALILTDILSFLGLLTHYNYSELVSSILHITTSEKYLRRVTISFLRLSSPSHPILQSGMWHVSSLCHSPPIPSACTHLSKPPLKTPSTVQHIRLDLSTATHTRPITSLEWDTRIFKTL